MRASSSPIADQVLPLEGDWDRHFTLYCPEGYERDALQVMTPDVMAAMIDGAQRLVGSDARRLARLRLVGRPSPGRGPRHYARAIRLIEVAQQFDEQAEHYSDSRIGDRARDVIAPQGRTLRGRWNPIFAVALLVPLAVIILGAAMPYITGGT